MKVTERFEIGEPLGRETHLLRAETYNRARLLLARSGEESLFVPIRPMQYLAVVEAREFIFVDGLGSRKVSLMWQRFRPNARVGLDDPVPFELVYFHSGAREVMPRLHVELPRALDLMAARMGTRSAAGGSVVPLRRPGTPNGG